MGRRVRSLSRESQDSVADVGSYAGEIIRQIKTVQSYARERFEIKAFAGEVDLAFQVAKRRIKQRSILMGLVILLAFTAPTLQAATTSLNGRAPTSISLLASCANSCTIQETSIFSF